MSRIHSIRNPDTFSDCISMLIYSKQNRVAEWNIDIVSQRCFNIQYEQEMKRWIHTSVSVKESIQNINSNTGSKLLIQKVRYMDKEEFNELSEIGAVLGPLERKELNQIVEDMYFIGGKHFVFFSGIADGFAVLHDPDSSPCILLKMDRLLDILIKEDVFCITMEDKCNEKIDGYQIMKKGINSYLKSERPFFTMKICRGGTDLASFRYGLRLYLFYNYEILSAIELDKELHEEITAYFRFSAEGYFDCRWERFLEIEQRFRELLVRCGSIYGIE